MASRLPTPGSDDGTWGSILNEFLSIGHNTDGTLKISEVVVTASDVAGVDAAPALETIISNAVANGIGRIQLPNIDINIQSDIDITALPTGGLEIYGSPGTRLIHSGGTLAKAMLYARGSDGTKIALDTNLTAGAQTITLPSSVVSSLVTGDVIGLQSEEIVLDPGNDDIHSSEMHKVIAISGNNVTIDCPLFWSYTVANSAQCWRLTMLPRLHLRNIIFTSSDPLVNRLRCILIDKAVDVLIDAVTLRDAGGGIILNDVMDANVRSVICDRLPNYGDFRGYGICVSGRSANVDIVALKGRGTRHLFTTLHQQETGGNYGAPRQIKVIGGSGMGDSDYAVWDTHVAGIDVHFDGCSASGGTGAGADGFQVRGQYVRLTNCRAYRMGGTGIQADARGANMQVIGGEFSYNTNGGMALGPNALIADAYIHHNTGGGVSVGSISSNGMVSNNKIEENTYGLHDQSTDGEISGVTVANNYIPQSSTQTISFLSPKSNIVFTGNILPGYGSNLDGTSGTIGANVTSTANIIDS